MVGSSGKPPHNTRFCAGDYRARYSNLMSLSGVKGPLYPESHLLCARKERKRVQRVGERLLRLLLSEAACTSHSAETAKERGGPYLVSKSHDIADIGYI